MPPKQNIPILVVNLKRSKDRRSYMQQQLDAYGVRYQFFPAVDGKTLTPQQRACYSEEESLRRFGHPLTNGEIGCALSHLQIYKKMVAEDIAELLILEDDIVIKKDFFPIIFQRAQWAPVDWKILHFATRRDNVQNSTLPCYFIDVEQRYRLYRYTKYYNRTHCYIVKQESAQWLINEGYPIHLPADMLMARTYKVLRCYTIPEICDVSDNLNSIIEIDPMIEKRYVSNILRQERAKIRRRRTYLIRKLGKRMLFVLSAHYSSYRRLRHFLKDIRNVPVILRNSTPIILRNMLWRLSVVPFLKWRWKGKRIRIED